MLNIGEKVEILVKDADLNLASKTGIKYFTLSGIVQRSAHYDPPETIRLFTANKDFPVSVVRLKNIVEVSGKKISLEKTDSQTWEVKGSKGATYTVSRIGSDYSCNCVGFQYRRKCKHVSEIAK
jgi:hypothetical protein